ncbi:hypothetical protein ATANTOWER_032088 [Ataeniobius toweri]|uniref:Uncharacterized protein n=1 Tax=Ataeniobius toweri TaxID=208326 RepID=A0ABU7B677_9TELE|nr:hypothetical protein [Ataeniobius toweri]
MKNSLGLTAVMERGEQRPEWHHIATCFLNWPAFRLAFIDQHPLKLDSPGQVETLFSTACSAKTGSARPHAPKLD